MLTPSVKTVCVRSEQYPRSRTLTVVTSVGCGEPGIVIGLIDDELAEKITATRMSRTH